MVADKNIPGIFDYSRPWVKKNQTVVLKRNNRYRVYYGGEPESDLKRYLPYMLKVAEVYVQGRKNKSHSGGNKIHFSKVYNKKQRLPAWDDAAQYQKNDKNDHIKEQCDKACNGRRKYQ